MRRALHVCVSAGIAVAGVAGLVTAAPVPPRSLPDGHIRPVRLSSDAAPLDGETLLGGLDLTGSGPISDILTPYLDIATNTFSDLETIVGQRLGDPAPILSAILENQLGYVQQVLADPASITDIPGEIAGRAVSLLTTLTSLVTISPDLASTPPTLDILVGVPLALLIGGLAPALAPVDAVKETVAGLASGDPATALTALIDVPATLANDVIAGFLRPEFVSSGAAVPADQISQINPALDVIGLPPLPVQDYASTVGGIGGLVDTVVNYLPRQVADALTGPGPEYAVSPVVLVEAVLHELSGLSPDTASDLPATLTADLGAEPLADPLSALPF